MLFNSVTFVIFFILFLPTFYLLKGKERLIFVLIASYIFYGWWDWRFLSLLMYSTLLDYQLARKIYSTSKQTTKKWLLALSLMSNLGMLAFFKYFNFFIESFNSLLGTIGLASNSNVLHIILPIGISFYTFQSLSYTLDVYYDRIKPEGSLLKFASFIALFPQLVAGPIVRAKEFLPQMKDNDRRPIKKDLTHGLDQVFLGFFKKVVVADSLAPVVDGAFLTPIDFSSIHLIVVVIFYSFQIYCDFSGYSDIAIGLARMMGYRFPINFNLPYLSASFSEFWSRWHITLSSWLRDYLYIPLGGNRKGKFKTYRNIMITMVLGGLWHGANWTFIMWGVLHGGYQVVQKILEDFSNTKNLKFKGSATIRNISRLVSIGFVYTCICFAWIFFRSPNFGIAIEMINGIISLDDMSLASIINKFWVAKGFLLIGLLCAFELLKGRINFRSHLDASDYLRPTVYAVMVWGICLLGTFADNGFIYFQF